VCSGLCAGGNGDKIPFEIPILRVDSTLSHHLKYRDGYLEPVFGSRHRLLVPPSVEVRPHQLPKSKGEQLCLVYPVPDLWWSPDYCLAHGEELVQHVESTSLQDGDDEENIVDGGWHYKGSQGSLLLSELLNLAPAWEEKPTDAVLEREAPKVQRFVERWGPLWRCMRPSHSALWVGRCYWEPGWLRQRTENCRWYPAEEVSAFLQEAQRAKAVLEAAKHLQKGCVIPEPIKQHLVHWRRSRLRTVEQQYHLVSSTIHYYLWGGPWVQFDWRPGALPKLDIVTETGFIHVVWMHIAQLLCNVRGFAQCDGCGAMYAREQRKPRADQRNFCPDCGTKASKRLYAQRRRAAHRGT
jgi:hypothetical protein